METDGLKFYNEVLQKEWYKRIMNEMSEVDKEKLKNEENKLNNGG